jgi:hypothetical protein
MSEAFRCRVLLENGGRVTATIDRTADVDQRRVS